MISISDITDARIACFRSLKDANLRQSNKIIVESEKVVLKLLASKINIIKIFASSEFINANESLISNRCQQIYTAPRSLMEQIIGYNLHHSVMALADRPYNLELSDLTFPCVVLNGLVSAENVGAIIRNCAAFGIQSLLIDDQTCSPYIRRAIRVSMGNIFKISVRQTSTLADELSYLSSLGIPIIATANVPEAVNLTSFKKKELKYAVIIGNEGHGIEPTILENSDYILKIPVDDETAAVNAACASAIFLYHLQQ